ncbi:hypothetical protein ACFLRP_05080 [Bacteroidota bacterium]
MKAIKRNLVALLLVLALLMALNPIAAFASSPLVNGSFETGDYTGWTLWEDGPYGHYVDTGTWGIAVNGETIISGETTYDFYDGVIVPQYSVGLPITYATTDGEFMAYQLQNGPEDHRMYQDVTLSGSAKTLSWDMFYTSDWAFSNAQYLAVNIRDLDDNILGVLYKTEGDMPQSIPITNFIYDISEYAGSTIRIDVEMKVYNSYFDAGFDNFVIDQGGTPPGWSKGKKSGWDGSMPPGLEKKDKTPAGFDKGNKTGWQ